MSISCSSFIELVLQEGQKWTAILVDSAIFQDFLRLDPRTRLRILDRRRKNDKDFLADDARVLVTQKNIS